MSLNRKTYDASTRWGVQHPRAGARIAAVVSLGLGIAAIWWTLANLNSSNAVVGTFLAAAGATLGAAGSIYWAYVGLVRGYAVGTISKVVVRVYTYALILSVLVLLFTFDHAAGVSFLAAGLLAAALVVLTPLVLIGNRRYMKDPSAGPELAKKAHELTGFGGPPRD